VPGESLRKLKEAEKLLGEAEADKTPGGEVQLQKLTSILEALSVDLFSFDGHRKLFIKLRERCAEFWRPRLGKELSKAESNIPNAESTCTNMTLAKETAIFLTTGATMLRLRRLRPFPFPST